jgi:hypothetical protein
MNRGSIIPGKRDTSGSIITGTRFGISIPMLSVDVL